MQERYVVCDVLGCCQYSIATNYFLLELQLKKGQFRTMTSVVMVQSVDDEKEVNAGRSWNHRTCWTFLDTGSCGRSMRRWLYANSASFEFST